MLHVIKAYCVECREEREMNDPQEVEMPGEGGRGIPALKGACAVCGTGMFKILKQSS